MPIQPVSFIGLTVLVLFTTCMTLIILESKLRMDKCKPALAMLLALPLIGLYYFFSGDDAARFAPFAEMQLALKEELFALIAFMAFMWMVVELLEERGVFSALISALNACGLGPRGIFWATGALSALLSPFLNNITTAMIFGKAIKQVSNNSGYTNAALCNIIIASNSGVWFLGTATSLMVVLAGKIQLAGLLMLMPAAMTGWIASALVLQLGYVNKLQGVLLRPAGSTAVIKAGGYGMIVVGVLAVTAMVVTNIVLHVDIEFGLGAGLGIILLYTWLLKRRGEDVPLQVQLQKVEWNTLLFFIGVIGGVAAINHVGWLGYISRLFETISPTAVNVILGMISGILDNVPVEAAALMSAPDLPASQWALNVMMVGIGGSLTVIGSAAGVVIMSLERSYTFGAHLKFWPAILTNFMVSLGVWYLQFKGMPG
jgi:Na+/H+ antiporter NhaD/arsenite permease-like protein